MFPGKDLESQFKKAEASGDVSFSQVPSLDHTRNVLESVVINRPNREFSQYDTVPEWIKNDPTNPINYKVYSNQINADIGGSKPSQDSNKQGIESVNKPTSNEDFVTSDTFIVKETLTNDSYNKSSSTNNNNSYEDMEKETNAASFSPASKF